MPKAAQIARYAPDNSLIGVTSLNSDTVSLIDPSFREQTAIKVGSQPMDMAFHGDELFVACQGDGSVHVIDIPNRRAQAQLPGRHGLRVARLFLDQLIAALACIASGPKAGGGMRRFEAAS